MTTYGSLAVLKQQLNRLNTLERQNEEYLDFINRQKSAIFIDESKIKELQGNLLKNLFQKGKVQLEISKYESNISSKKQSISKFQAMYDENNKDLPLLLEKIKQNDLPLPKQYINLETIGLLHDIADKLCDDLQRDPTLEEVYDLFETEHPAKVVNETNFRNTNTIKQQPHSTDKVEYYPEYLHNEVESDINRERREREEYKEKIEKEYQEMQANYADQARHYGEDRDKVRHLDDLAGRSLADRVEADRRKDYRENEHNMERGGF